MKKRILCTLIFSLLVLTACSSETPNATPDEIAPSVIIETKVKETVAPTEKPTESIEAETVVVTTDSEQQVEVKIVEHVEETQAPAPARI